jgi:dTMP kinase
MKLSLPLFVLLEGIDGTGKSTLAKGLYNHFQRQGIPAIMLAEPTRGKWGMKIREKLSGGLLGPEEQVDLFIKDREDDVKKNIIPSLRKNMMIIMDRYYFSNAAYQGAMGLTPEEIIRENRKRGFPEPDRVYLIDTDPETALERIRGRRDSDGLEVFERRHFLEKVRGIYLSLADDSFSIIDGGGSIGDITDRIINDITDRFGI